jgi:uncharacterized protein
MTPDERNLLSRFLQDLSQARGGLKDAEASDMIERSLRSNPDAAYLLVQHALISDQALHAAQDRIAHLESQLRGGQPFSQGGGSFLGGGPWASRPQPSQPSYDPGYVQAPPQRSGGMLGGLFGGGQPVQPGGFGSFLRSAGTTAAGVAGGEFLFSGLSNLFGGGRGGFGGPVENVTINEYGDGGDMGLGGYDDGGFDDGGYDDGGMS